MKFNPDFTAFIKEIKLSCKEVYDSYLLRYAYGVDASCYNYIPKVVINAQSEDEVINILNLANIYHTHITFRAAGTSLSGQSSSDGVLVVANKAFKDIRLNDDASIIECDCGVIASEANEVLKPFGRKIGPDPATIATALIGGIINNNSSGMCCGVEENSYNTIHSLRVILLDGTILDTGDASSVLKFIKTHKNLTSKLLGLREQILSDKELSELIRRKFKIKNTTGYSINSLLDFSEIKDIINHIFIGSEGTLGFVSKVRYYTVKDSLYKGCGLLFFKNLDETSKAVVRLASLGRELVNAAEMMDYECLKAVMTYDGIPSIVKECQDGYTCILFQSVSDNEKTLDENLEKIKGHLSDLDMAFKPLFSKDSNEQDGWWKIRKGILPIVAGARSKGTAVITEDVCFKIEDFCDGVKLIKRLFEKYNFKNGVIFGHALSGNLHFIITPDLSNAKEYENFANLVNEMSRDISKIEGSVKAEHGTGRMVAPFVELEWGKKAYEINVAIKEAFDEKNLLNPDVIITKDKEIYKKNLKAMTIIENLPLDSDIINTCMECGFCEKHCPSKDITLTPRQRISVLREITRLNNENQTTLAAKLLKEYEYYGVQTCATCSRCFDLCPLYIDTAGIALSLRKSINVKYEKIAQKAYANFDKVVKVGRVSLSVYTGASRIFGGRNLSKISKITHKILRKIPFAPPKMPFANNYEFKNKLGFDEKVIYFSACINRMFKPNTDFNDTRNLQEVFESLCKKAKISVLYPENLASMCCGKIFADYENIALKNKQKLQDELLKLSDYGRINIVIDHSSCFYEMFKNLKETNLKILDLSEFLLQLAPRLEIKKTKQKILVHKLCLLKKLKKDSFIEDLARLCSDEVEVIKSFECCGFAGDKGFFTPELNQSSTKNLKFETKDFDLGVSTSSTCEVGLNSYGAIPFVNIAYLLDMLSNAREY